MAANDVGDDGGAAGLVRVAGENESINYTAERSMRHACPPRVTNPPGANFPRKEVHEAWERSIAYYRVTKSGSHAVFHKTLRGT
jgi:hypothetical protein